MATAKTRNVDADLNNLLSGGKPGKVPTKTAAKVPAGKPVLKLPVKVAPKLGAKIVGKTAVKLPVKLPVKPTGKLAVKPAGKPAGKPAVKPTGKPGAKTPAAPPPAASPPPSPPPRRGGPRNTYAPAAKITVIEGARAYKKGGNVERLVLLMKEHKTVGKYQEAALETNNPLRDNALGVLGYLHRKNCVEVE